MKLKKVYLLFLITVGGGITKTEKANAQAFRDIDVKWSTVRPQCTEFVLFLLIACKTHLFC